jgi:hypothetical protein
LIQSTAYFHLYILSKVRQVNCYIGQGFVYDGGGESWSLCTIFNKSIKVLSEHVAGLKPRPNYNCATHIELQIHRLSPLLHKLSSMLSRTCATSGPLCAFIVHPGPVEKATVDFLRMQCHIVGICFYGLVEKTVSYSRAYVQTHRACDGQPRAACCTCCLSTGMSIANDCGSLLGVL